MTTITSIRTGVQRRTLPANGHFYRARMVLLMLSADVLGFTAAGAFGYALNLWLKYFKFDMGDAKYGVILALCLIFFANSRLYPGVGISPVSELKLVTQSVSLGFASGVILLTMVQRRLEPNYTAFLMLWIICLVMILFMRWSMRFVASKAGLWGEPVVVIGHGTQVSKTVRYFAQRRRLGFVPVVAATDSLDYEASLADVPVMPYSLLMSLSANRFSDEGIHTALVDVAGISEFFRSDDAKALFQKFRRLILVSDLDWIDGAAMQIQDFEGRIGIAAQKSVLSPIDALTKRALDIVGSLVLGTMALPVMIATAIWIKLDSPGPVFYRHERVGQDGRRIRILKFRSMLSNADSALEEYLRNNAAARTEWEATHKLCDDPRVTRAGKWLRKLSIDEIPQFFNVLRGDMSLVGPRPIVNGERHHFGSNIEIYENMRPGMTGLWQVSGRSETSYAERVRFDTFYVRNWSVWLDLYVLMRTVWVVVNRNGAY